MGDEPPVKLQPWNVVTTLSPLPNRGGVGGEAKVVRLDHPVVGIDGLEMMGLRKTHAVLSAQDYQLASKAAELIYWDANTKYCGVCGAPTKWMTDISKKCPECGKEWWPSPSTAIIVRVTKDPPHKDLQLSKHSTPSLARLEGTLDPSRTGRAGGESPYGFACAQAIYF